MSEIGKVAVIGAGTMGHGIAQVAATVGQEVSLVDVFEEILSQARDRIRWSLDKLFEKNIIKEAPSNIIERIIFTTNLRDAVKDTDLVIEAAPEDVTVKMKIFSEIDGVAPPKAIFASNTSSLPISALSQATQRQDRFIGMHWMNPPVFMRLIELIKGARTSQETVQRVAELCRLYNKEPIVVERDVWCFLTGRAHMGWNMGTAWLSYSREAAPEEIDAMARYRMGLPMGPFELADFTGAIRLRVDGLASIKKILEKYPNFEPWAGFLKAYERITEKVWKPMVEMGLEGVKAGKGFYTYPEPGKYKKVELSQDLADKISPVKALAAAANTSAWCVSHGVGTLDDVDKGFKLAYGWPKGVFDFVKQYGAAAVVRELEEKRDRVPEEMKEFYSPDPLLRKM